MEGKRLKKTEEKRLLWHVMGFWKLNQNSCKQYLWEQGISTGLKKQYLVRLSTYVNDILVELQAVRQANSWRSQRWKKKKKEWNNGGK